MEGKAPQAGWKVSLVMFFFFLNPFPELFALYPGLYYINKGLKQHPNNTKKISSDCSNKTDDVMK